MPRVAADRREAHLQARRNPIPGVALGLFSSRGFDGSTVVQIVHAAGIAKENLYRYFPNKTPLLEGVIHRYTLLPIGQ